MYQPPNLFRYTPEVTRFRCTACGYSTIKGFICPETGIMTSSYKCPECSGIMKVEKRG